ncbi:hypothetical protein D3C85_664950 [compost metagenome]
MVELATPLSVDWLPSTVDAAPVADEPKPPAAALAPDDTACTVVTLLSDTNGPILPVTRSVTAESKPPTAVPTLVNDVPCTLYVGVPMVPEAAV